MIEQPQRNERLGYYVETSAMGESVRAFVPPPLPPVPAIEVLPLLERLSLAERALGRLDGISVLSNYVDAMTSALERLQDLPLSLRLIREMHERLLKSGRGQGKAPGEFRRSQNWIGGTRPGNALFVPPPVTELDACLYALEQFFHETDSKLPSLIKAGLIHVQFETIHPFLDGNGRIGRLLVRLFLCVQGVLRSPLLYLSLYLKTHRGDYYRLLQEVREHGAWEAWLEFFDGYSGDCQPSFRCRNTDRRVI